MSQDQERGSSARLWWLGCGCGCGGCLLAVVALLVLVTGGAGLGLLMLGKSDLSQEAVARARAHPAVIAAIGEPIEAGFLVSGSINIDGNQGDAELRIPISGSDGDATVHVKAHRRDGEWQYELLEVEISETNERIDLMEP